MSVAKIIEIVSESEKSFDDAIQRGLAEAAKTIRGISGLEIENFTAKVHDNRITHYKVTLHIAFAVQHAIDDRAASHERG